MDHAAESPKPGPEPRIAPESMRDRVRSAVFWRSGSQIIGQLVMWSSTFLVIRLLVPQDYGLFAMTQVVLAGMSLMNGYSFAGALVQSDEVDAGRAAQVFGILIVMNFALAAAQFLLAPVVAAYFGEPIVADMLRVQAVLHLFTPFIIMPQAMLARRIDFRTQAKVNLAAAAAAAITAPAAALAGFGVWTLVVAPIALFGTRALGLAIVGRWLIWPSFRLSGARTTFGFGGAMLASDILWFVQSQADVFIAGRRLQPHDLGLYTTALFLASIIVSKFVPALNEVAFPAYARMQRDPTAVSQAFVRAVRVILIAAMPCYAGLAVTAEPLVLAALGEKWAGVIPVVRLLALAMPFVTVQILYAPAVNALGRPGRTAWASGAGALIMPAAFLIGVGHGPVGMAWSWLAGFPLLLVVSSALALPVIGVRAGAMLRAAAPGVGSAAVMVLAVALLDHALPALSPLPRLACLVPAGAVVYALALKLLAPAALGDAIGMLRR